MSGGNAKRKAFKCPGCGCEGGGGGSTSPNCSCGCTDCARGGLVSSCDPGYKVWPATVAGTFASAANSWTVETFTRLNFGGYPGLTEGSLPAKITSETAYMSMDIPIGPDDNSNNAGWAAPESKPDYSTVTISVAWRVAGGLSLPPGPNVGCNVFGQGSYVKVQSTKGQSYVFDTLTGSGLPRVRCVVTQAGSARSPTSAWTDIVNYAYVGSDAWTASKSSGENGELTLVDRADAYSTRTVASAGYNGTASVTFYGGAPTIRFSYTDMRENSTSIGGPQHVADLGTVAFTPKSRLTTHNLFSTLFTLESAAAYPLGPMVESYGAAPASLTGSICHGSITATTTDPGVPKNFDGNQGIGIFRGTDATKDSFSALLLLGNLSATTSAGSVGTNAGCQNCPRAFTVSVRSSHNGAASVEAVPPTLMVQVCSGQYVGPGFAEGWPYTCVWRSFTDPDFQLAKVGPLEWRLGGYTLRQLGGDCDMNFEVCSDASEIVDGRPTTGEFTYDGAGQIVAFTERDADNDIIGTATYADNGHTTLTHTVTSNRTILDRTDYTLTISPTSPPASLCCACDDDGECFHCNECSSDCEDEETDRDENGDPLPQPPLYATWYKDGEGAGSGIDITMYKFGTSPCSYADGAGVTLGLQSCNLIAGTQARWVIQVPEDGRTYKYARACDNLGRSYLGVYEPIDGGPGIVEVG